MPTIKLSDKDTDKLFDYALLLLSLKEENALIWSRLEQYKKMASLFGYSGGTAKNIFFKGPTKRPLPKRRFSIFCDFFLKAKGIKKNKKAEFTKWQTEIFQRYDRSAQSEPFDKKPKIAANSTSSNQKSSFISQSSFIKRLTKKPLYFYHSTKSEDGELYWKLTVLDFRSHKLSNEQIIVTEAIIPNLAESTTIEYVVEIKRQFSFDPILLTLRSKLENEQLIMAILDPIKSYVERVSGFIYHDDWTTNWRLSGCLLSFKPLTKQNKTRGLPSSECVILQELWNSLFKKKTIFEEYKIPPKKK